MRVGKSLSSDAVALVESLERRTLLSSGVLDPTFGSGGVVLERDAASGTTSQPLFQNAEATAALPNGQSLVAGSILVNNQQGSYIRRYNSDGSIDQSFGAGLGYDGASGYVFIPALYSFSGGQVVEMQIDSQGRILLGIYNTGILRLSASGVVDTSFGSNGYCGLSYRTPRFALDGSFIVAAQSNDSTNVVEFTSAGQVNSSFGSGGEVNIEISAPNSSPPLGFYTPIVIGPNGDILIGGGDESDYDRTGMHLGIARLLPNGTLDSSFGNDGIAGVSYQRFDDPSGAGLAGAYASALAVLPNGNIIAGGVEHPDDNNDDPHFSFTAAEFLSNGSIDTAFADQGQVDPIHLTANSTDEAVRQVFVAGDGSLVFAGTDQSSTSGGYEQGFFLAGYTAAGAVNTSFGTSNGLTISIFGPTPSGEDGPLENMLDATVTFQGQILTVGSAGITDNAAGLALARYTYLAPSAAPTGVTAITNAGAITLVIPSVPGATSYNIYRSTSSQTEGGDQLDVLSSGASLTLFTDTSVTPGVAYFYVVTAVGASGPSLPSSEVSATPVNVSALSDADIATKHAGSGSASGGVWTVSGSGDDIFNYSDQFNYYSTTSITGNASLIAEVTSLTDTNPFAKGGVMFRNSADPSSAEVSLVATPANGVIFQWRSVAGAASSSVKATSVAAPSAAEPVWLQLLRSASGFSAFYSLDGISWTQLGVTEAISLDATTLAGLAVTAHNGSSLATATFSQVAIAATATAPAMPTGVTAVSGTNAITLDWPSVPNATSYNIYRSTGTQAESLYQTSVAPSGASCTVFTDASVAAGTTYYYMVTAVNSSGESLRSTEVSAAPLGSLALTDQDIATTGPAGSAIINNSGVWSVSGSGADIYNAADEFNFAHTPVSGNMSLIAQMTSQTDSNSYAKSGVMFRADTTDDAAQVSLFITPANGVIFEWRSKSGGNTSSVLDRGISIPTPVWLELLRVGSTYSAFYSPDGSAWTQVGTAQTISLGSSPIGGLAVTSHNPTTLSTATFADTGFIQLGIITDDVRRAGVDCEFDQHGVGWVARKDE